MGHLAPHHAYTGKTYGTSDLVTHGYDYEVVRLDQHAPVERAITTRYLDRHIQDGSVVADIGVGAGHYSEGLARRGCSLHLVDVSERLLETTVQRLRDAGLGERIGGVYHASATDLSFLPTGCCDAVLLLGPLYHLGDAGERRIAIDEAARILRPGGLVFAAGINRITYLWDLLHNDPDCGAARAEFLARYMQDGNFDPPVKGFPPTVHLATAEEFRSEMGTAFKQVAMVGTESFAGKLEQKFLSASPESQAVWLYLVEQTGPTPEGLGITDHFLFIGRR
jgi:SAM-dependent methyltransferase